jgi:L-asparagine oxygenase
MIGAATRRAQFLPRGMQLLLAQFRKHGSPTGTMLLSFPQKSLGGGDLPPTPLTNRTHVGAKTALAREQATINQFLGETIGYEAEAGGQLFQDMVPNPDLAHTQTSVGSAVELELHVEQAFSKWRPDLVSLACLRGDPNAQTYVFHVQKALSHVTPVERKMLLEPRWTIGVDLSFRMHGQPFLDGDVRGPLPIVYPLLGDDVAGDNDVGWVFDQDLMRGITPDAEDLRLKLVDVYMKHRTALVLKPGDLLWIDNRRAVHGRSHYTPRFDGTDRFLVRSFVTFDFQKSAAVRHGRVVLARYS